MPIPRRQQTGEWLPANGKISRPISSTNYSEESGDRQDKDSDFHQSYPLDTSSMQGMGGEESGAGYAAFLGLLGVVSVSIFCVNTSTTFVANALNQTISC
jgi:hypothetical protein